MELYLARLFAAYDRSLPPDGLYERVLAEIEPPLLLLSLAAARGNQVRAARLLGMNRNTLRKKLAERGIDAPTVRRMGDAGCRPGVVYIQRHVSTGRAWKIRGYDR